MLGDGFFGGGEIMSQGLSDIEKGFDEIISETDPDRQMDLARELRETPGFHQVMNTIFSKSSLPQRSFDRREDKKIDR